MKKYGHHRDKPMNFRHVRRPIIIILAFVAFFVFSNYYMGLFSSVDDEPLKTNAMDSSDKTYRDKADKKLKRTELDEDRAKLDDTIERDTPNWPKEPLLNEKPDDTAEHESSCRHTRNRDYDKQPIIISGRFSGKADKCDVPCMGEGSPPDAVVGFRQTQCPHIKSIFFTMENSIPPPNSYDIVANTQLTSDVPVPYYSWAEYNFFNRVQKKTASAHIAAFISNCGPQRRLQWMETMMKHGIKIHSYGNCMRNKEVPEEYAAKYGANYNALKVALVSTYKFTMAFENSATDDYVTEKLFGVLVAGSVPLYDGASNGKKFGPSAHSMIFAEDYGTPEKLAEYLLYLDSNDTAYEEYLQWKKHGPTDDWVALVDMANVHSNCRLCIRTADLHRKEIGPVRDGQPKGEPKPDSEDVLELKVRERGNFWLRSIYLTAANIEELRAKVTEFVPHDPEARLHSIYDLWTRTPIETNRDIDALSQRTELEAVFVVHQDWTDKNLMW